jgi:predicted enzyme related to lactoylglutathione lyase
MKRLATIAMLACAAFAGSFANADVTLNGSRIGAKDVLALAKFYQQAFGMHEVNRITQPNMIEVMLNFGDTPEAAKANVAAQIVIMQRASDETGDTMAHVVMNVTDMNATVKALTAAGGKMERAAFEYGTTGIVIGLAIDPAGNHFELIQWPKRP